MSEAIGKVADWRAYILPEHATETKFTTASKLQMLTHLKKGSQFLSRASLSGKEEASFKKVLATPSFLPEHMPNGKNVYVEVGTAKSGLPGQHSTGWDATIQLVSGKQFWYFYPPGASTFRYFLYPVSARNLYQRCGIFF